MDDRVPVAVIILNWNGRALLEEYLPQVLANSDPSVSKIVVADNGSTDNSVAYLKNTFGHCIEIITFDKNYGFAEGYNRALDLCSDYEFSVLLNSDVAPAIGWDRVLYDFMRNNHDYAACQPKILSYKDKTRFEYAGACGGFLDRDAYPFCRGRIFDNCEEDKGQYDILCDVHWASGACLMVRTSLYLQCGGLDKEFFAHMEEIDLCWRMRLAGYRLACVPGAAVYHLGGGSLPAENPYKTYLNFRNNLLMMYKNLPDSDRSRALIRRCLLDTLAWLKFLLAFDMKNAGSVIRAHRDFSKMCKKYFVHPSENILKGPQAFSKSILMQYFLWHRKFFSSLKGLPGDSF